jgi:hypothetical protein
LNDPHTGGANQPVPAAHNLPAKLQVSLNALAVGSATVAPAPRGALPA